jgi:molybdenum cofactor sulfurtransferase
MADMMSNLYGNPHSASASSQLSTNRIEDTRLNVLQFFKADPKDFDVVFVANATAGIKLVMEGFRAHSGGSNSGGFTNGGFNYGYHKDSHTSIVGVRGNAVSSRCLDDEAVERFLSGSESLVDEDDCSVLNLFAYPAQSNLDGRRLPLSWLRRAREMNRAIYTLLDASALVSTSQLDLSDASKAPDFTVLSFYKIFGYPSLGALIVRKDSGSILLERKYFGGGTVDLVLCIKEQWHVPKGQSLHEALEDGTLPFHNIMALDAAIDVHKRLYGSMDRIANHTAYLAQKMFDKLELLRHANGEPVCVMHSHGFRAADSRHIQGPAVAFNVRNSHGAWVSNVEFERLATIRNFHIRSGGLCNPGGVATSLNLEPWEMRKNFSAGFRCGAETDIYAGKITGIIRASLGAMSTISDVESFISFVKEFYVEIGVASPISYFPVVSQKSTDFLVESLTIYPIKSCGGLSIPPLTAWEVRPEGLAWDREWCLVHQGTGQALSQKRHPRMALIRPKLDFQEGVLHVRYSGFRLPDVLEQVSIPLSSNPSLYRPLGDMKSLSSRVCGDTIVARTYASQEINEFFSGILGVPCALARFPAGGSGLGTRHSKAHMQKHQRPKRTSPNEITVPGAYPAPPTPPDSDNEARNRPILLSNESPILAINRSSLDTLNEEIRRTGGKSASASVFRANIVLASSGPKTAQQPYCEDHWTSLRIGQQDFQMLGSCRRCHMICVNQETAEKDEEPFVTLAKTRRFESKIFFGSHMCHVPSKGPTKESQCPTIRVGDVVSIGSRDD